MIYIGLPPRDTPLDYLPTPPDILVIVPEQVIFGYHCALIGFPRTSPRRNRPKVSKRIIIPPRIVTDYSRFDRIEQDYL